MKELRIFGICICVLLGTVMGNDSFKIAFISDDE